MDDDSGLPDRSQNDAADDVDVETSDDSSMLSEDSSMLSEDSSMLSAASDQEIHATAREEAALDRARRVSKLLDEAFRVPGTDFKIGLDPILGIVPGAGDAVAGLLSLYPIIEAIRLDTPRETIAMMLGLVAIDAVVGSVPVLGPVFDSFWKANEWNVRLLERAIQQG